MIYLIEQLSSASGEKLHLHNMKQLETEGEQRRKKNTKFCSFSVKFQLVDPEHEMFSVQLSALLQTTDFVAKDV